MQNGILNSKDHVLSSMSRHLRSHSLDMWKASVGLGKGGSDWQEEAFGMEVWSSSIHRSKACWRQINS